MTAQDRHVATDPDVLAERQRTDDFATSMNGWFWETDTQNRFTYMSTNVERLTGTSANWLYGKRRVDLGVPDAISEDEWQTHIETIENRKPFTNFVYCMTGPNGELWLRTSGQPIFDSQGEFQGFRGTATNITDEIEARERAIRLTAELEEKNRILETTLSTTPDGIHVVDGNLQLVAWNDQLFEIMDLDKDQVLSSDDPGRTLFWMLAARGEYGEGDIEELVNSRESIVHSGKKVHYERQLVTGRWIECRASPMPGGGFMGVYRDITNTRKLIDQLKDQAAFDPLTGALNRRKFTEIAEEEFSRARRYGRPLSLVMLDIDHFKAVNDEYGHAIGDDALRKVVELCKQGLRDTDRICRFGGEEFVLMLPETNAAGAAIVSDRLRERIAASNMAANGADVRVTISGGVAQVEDGQYSIENVIAAADTAMYEAKRAGRNRIICSQPAPQEDLAAAFGGG